MIGTMTVAGVLASGATTVSAFGGLILFIVSLGLGIWAVRFVIKQAKRAR